MNWVGNNGQPPIEFPVDTSDRHRWRDIRRLDHQGMVLPSQVCQLCGAAPIPGGPQPPCQPFTPSFAAKLAWLIELELQA